MLDSISSLAAQLLEVGEAEEARQLHRRMHAKAPAARFGSGARTRQR